MKRLGLSPRRKLLVVLPLLALYLAIADFPASMMRACVMAALAYSATALGRPRDGLSVISAAALLLTIIHPADIFNPGFQLSFSAVLGIVCLYPLLQSLYAKLPKKKYLRVPLDSIALSLSAQIGIIPFIALHFHHVPVFTFLINLLIIPLAALCTVGGMVCLILYYIIAPAALVLAHPVRWASAFTARLILGWNALNLPALRLPSPEILAILCMIAALLLASGFLLRSRLFRALSAAFCALAALLISLPLPEAGLNLRMLDVGQGDAVVVESQGHTYLFDVGPEGQVPLQYLSAYGRAVDAVFLSHPHDDHVGGLDALIGIVPIGRVYIPENGLNTADPLSGSALKKAREIGIPIIELSQGDALELPGDIRLDVLWPRRWEGENGDSMVTALRYSDYTFLFTGDIGMNEEIQIDWPRVDVLKMAHHGSKYSTGNMFLARARPEALLIGVGYNTYGHPSPDALNRAAGRRIFRTDAIGCIHLQVLDGGLSYSGFLEGAR